MIEQLDALIAELEAETDRLAERLRLARQLRATYSGLTPADLFACPECDRNFTSASGRKHHQTVGHPAKRKFDPQLVRDAAAAAI